MSPNHDYDLDKKPVAQIDELSATDSHNAHGREEIGDLHIDPAAEARLVRKIDLHLLPMLWLCYIMNYIDRSNIGNAKVGGMQKDLHLTSNDYSLVLCIFFVGYLLWEVPSNMILSHSKPRIYLPTIMFIWGAMSIGVKGVHNLGGMVAFRFVLGLVESGFFPGVMLLMSCWYKPYEMSKRVAIFYTASLLSGAFGGLLAGGIIEGLEGVAGTSGWRWLFIIEGLMTCFCAVISFFVLPNYPTTTSWLTEEEKRIAVARLTQGTVSADEAEAVAESPSHWGAFLSAAKDPKTWVFVLVYNLQNGAGTISYFFPTLMNALGYKGRQAQFMTVPIYAVSLVVSITGGQIADRTRQKAYVCLGAAILATVSFIIVITVQNDKVKYAFLCFCGAGIWTVVPVFLSWMITMFDGRERRGVSIALVNGFGNLASVYGAFLWDAKYAPKYIPGFAASTALCGALAMLIAFAKWKYGDKGVARTS